MKVKGKLYSEIGGGGRLQFSINLLSLAIPIYMIDVTVMFHLVVLECVLMELDNFGR